MDQAVRGYDEAMATTTLMTFEEFLELDDEPGKTELLEGELIRMPPAECSHMEIVERLYKLLDSAVEQLLQSRPELALGKVHIEMGYFLTQEPRSWLQPDVSVTYPGQARKRWYEGSPLLVFEVVSPNYRMGQGNRKVRQFLKHGAAEVWMIFPDERNAWVYERDAKASRLEEEAIRSPLLPGIEIPFSALFA